MPPKWKTSSNNLKTAVVQAHFTDSQSGTSEHVECEGHPEQTGHEEIWGRLGLVAAPKQALKEEASCKL